MQTLVRLGVPVAMCFGEADREVAALAREWHSPVLSNDSDFYIFELPGGLLPLTHFRWREVAVRGARSSIPCKKYRSSSLCALLGLRPQLLPALAPLAGNDYVTVCRSVPWAQFWPEGGRLGGLVVWLRRFQQPQEALEAALGLLEVKPSREQRTRMLQELKEGLEDYKLGPSVLKQFFIQGAAPPRPAGAKVVPVPDWMLLPLTQGRMPSVVLDVLQLHRNSLPNLVESGDLPSSQTTSRPLRQVLYGLLLGPGSPVQVQERDREGLEIRYIPVQPEFTSASRDLLLETLDQAALAQRLQVLLEALNVTETLLNLDPELRLTVAVTCYWQQRTGPDEAVLTALVLGLSSGVLRDRAEARTGPRVQVPLNVAHAFNQWQACLRDAMYLNQVLGFPLPEPQVARLYEGTLVHQLVHKAQMGEPGSRSLDPSRLRLFESTLAAVHQCRAQTATVTMVTAPDDTGGELRRHKDKVATATQEDQDLEDLDPSRKRYAFKPRPE
ncbi:uncharacterized protein V6R79_017051 [Siganus canaliculatus]